MGHHLVAAGQAQGVEEFRAAKGLANDLGFDRGVVVVNDVVGAQQHIALATFKGAGQGAFGHIAQSAHGGVDHHLAVDLVQGGWGEYAVANEVGHKAGGRSVVEAVGILPLVQAAFVHDPDDIANGKGLELVVRDEERGRAGCLEDGAQLMGQALAQLHVEVGKRLVEQQQLRLGRQRPRQRHPLLLAA